MNLPTLSVIVPNFNHGKYLPDCLDAILSQSVPALEVIVVDDGSTDNSVEILERYAQNHPTLKVYRNEKNQGALYTVNRGIDLASGDYLAFAAADDQILPGFFEKSLRLLAEHPQAGFCGSICRFTDMTTALSYHLGNGVSDQPRYFSPEEMAALSREGRLVVFTSTMIMKRDAFIKVGKYRAELRWHCDWFASFVVGFRHGMCFVPEVLGQFRVFSTGFSKKGMRDKTQQQAVLRRILETLDEPQFQDVAPFFRDGAMMACFGKEMLGLLLREKKYRRYLTWAYLRQALWWIIRIEGKKLAPRFVVKFYFKLAGYETAKSAAAAAVPKA